MPHVGRKAGVELHSGQQECMARITRSLGQANKPWISALLFSVTFEDLLIELHVLEREQRAREVPGNWKPGTGTEKGFRGKLSDSQNPMWAGILFCSLMSPCAWHIAGAQSRLAE